MDDIVKKAMAKWPNVPDCYGWLALDARGNWRMRDERVQQLGLAGDKVIQTALLAFINRNLAADERGCWYFQNGPQRVYLNLEATPFIARTDPVQGLVLQTGEVVEQIDHGYLSSEGALLFDCAGKIAQLDDRDAVQVMEQLELDGARATDEALLDWLAAPHGRMRFPYKGQQVPMEAIAHAEVAQRFQFVRVPAAH